jgi:hypothetical protein
LPNRTQILHVLKRLFFILIGYALASIASGIVVGIYDSGSLIVKSDFGIMLSKGFRMFALLSMVIAIYAALPAVIVVLIGESSLIQNKTYYAIAGCLIGMVLPIYVGFNGLIPIGFIFGPLAGLIYWRVAGRNAGLWQPKSA